MADDLAAVVADVLEVLPKFASLFRLARLASNLELHANKTILIPFFRIDAGASLFFSG